MENIRLFKAIFVRPSVPGGPAGSVRPGNDIEASPAIPRKYKQRRAKCACTHMLIVVGVLVVNFFAFLVITRHHQVGSGRN